MKKLTIVGDVHGRFIEYKRVIKDCERTLQVGDMGFRYEALNDVDPTKHYFIGGNHDNWDILNNYGKKVEEQLPYSPLHYLGKYGVATLNGVEFFYLSGGFSIDVKDRQRWEKQTGIKSYWPNEELSDIEFNKAYELYCKEKPQIVITHECPRDIANIIGNLGILRRYGFVPELFTTRTSDCLQKCYEAWQPKLWVFGHFHIDRDFLHGPEETRFICLPELGTVDIDNEAHVYYGK